MIFLERFKIKRFDAAQGARISCRSGVLWVTQQDDLRDLIVGPGESLEVGGGATVVVALESSVMTVAEHRPSSWGQSVITALRAMRMRCAGPAARTRVGARLVPYVSPYF